MGSTSIWATGQRRPTCMCNGGNQASRLWLNPVALHGSGGLRPHETRQAERVMEEHEGDGMYVSTTEVSVPEAMTVSVTEEALAVRLSDGHQISVPYSGIPAWFTQRPRSEVTGSSLAADRVSTGPAWTKTSASRCYSQAGSRARVDGPSGSGWRPKARAVVSHSANSQHMSRKASEERRYQLTGRAGRRRLMTGRVPWTTLTAALGWH